MAAIKGGGDMRSWTLGYIVILSIAIAINPMDVIPCQMMGGMVTRPSRLVLLVSLVRQKVMMVNDIVWM